MPPSALRRFLLRVAWSTSSLLASACGGRIDPTADPLEGPTIFEPSDEGSPSRVTLAANVFIAETELREGGVRLVVDTGAPVTIIDPVAGGVPQGKSTIALLEFGGRTLRDVAVIGFDLLGSSTLPIEGVLGCTPLCAHALYLDYRAEHLTIDEVVLPADLADEVVVPFQLEGGGVGILPGTKPEFVTMPPSRILVEARIGSTRRTLMVDTGASITTVSSDVFRTLTRNRPVLAGFATASMLGEGEAKLGRVDVIEVAGARVDGDIVSHSSNIDTLLKALSTEVHHEVDGVLGGTFLRHFHVAIDFPTGELVFRRYPTQAHVRDEATRIGVVLGGGTGRVLVNHVFAGSDAEKNGLRVGDEIVSIDGTALAAERVELVDPTLAPEGTSHMVEVRPAAGGPTRRIRVTAENLLPFKR